MLNKILLPEGGIKAPTQVFSEPANEAQLAQAIVTGREFANDKNNLQQHRNAIIGPDGRESQRTVYVCTGQNICNRELLLNSVFLFAYPGEPQRTFGSNPTFRCDYKFSNDSNAPGRRWLRYLMDPKNSPYRYILQFVHELDADKNYDQRFILFQHIDQLPWEIHQAFMMACRWQLECPQGLSSWIELVDQGVDPTIAFFQSLHFTKIPNRFNRNHLMFHHLQYTLQDRFNGKFDQIVGQYLVRSIHSHEPMVNGWAIFDNWSQGRYVAQPWPVRRPTSAAPFTVVGPRRQENLGISIGYSTRGYYTVAESLSPAPGGTAMKALTTASNTGSLVTQKQIEAAIMDLINGEDSHKISAKKLKKIDIEFAEDDAPEDAGWRLASPFFG